MPQNDNRGTSRRALLKASGIGGLSLLTASAGCLESGEDPTTDPGGDGGDGGDGNGDTTADGGDGGDSDSIAIGMVTSLTGSLAPYGERNQRGKELALSAINERGIGSNGRSLEVLVEDSESKNDSGVNAARKLVDQNQVPLLVGAVGSGVSLAIHNSVVKGTDVVHISQNSTSPALTEEPELLRTSPSGAAKWTAMAKLLSSDGHSTVAATWINNDYGQGFADVFPDEFDGEVAYVNPHDQDQSSYRGVLSEMANTDATAWLFITYANEFTIMAREAYDQGFNEEVDYYGAESTIADDILADTPEGSQEGMKGITESAPVDQESYQQFTSDFNSEFDQDPTVWAAYAYDAIVIAAIAAEAADEVSGAALGNVVRDVTRPEGQKVYSFDEAKDILADGGGPGDIDYEGVSGPVDLDENGDPPGFYQVYSVQDHAYEFGDFVTG